MTGYNFTEQLHRTLAAAGLEPAGLCETMLNVVKPGKATVPPGLDLPLTSRAKRVLELALIEATDLKHPAVGSAHLLLGLQREAMGIAGQVLTRHGAALERLRAEALRQLAQGPAETVAPEE